MNVTSRKRTLAFLLFIGLISGCVSVNIGGPKRNQKAEGVKFNEPQAPFVKAPQVDVDEAWKNQQNGNLISFLTDCQDTTDPMLDSIVHGSLAGLADLKIESSETPTIQGREARRVRANGKVDGVPTRIDLVVFKRNQCIYMLTYVGVQKAFIEDHPQFDRFISGFRAP